MAGETAIVEPEIPRTSRIGALFVISLVASGICIYLCRRFPVPYPPLVHIVVLVTSLGFVGTLSAGVVLLTRLGLRVKHGDRWPEVTKQELIADMQSQKKPK